MAIIVQPAVIEGNYAVSCLLIPCTTLPLIKKFLQRQDRKIDFSQKTSAEQIRCQAHTFLAEPDNARLRLSSAHGDTSAQTPSRDAATGKCRKNIRLAQCLCESLILFYCETVSIVTPMHYPAYKESRPLRLLKMHPRLGQSSKSGMAIPQVKSRLRALVHRDE
jgi:hypothetical protein